MHHKIFHNMRNNSIWQLIGLLQVIKLKNTDKTFHKQENTKTEVSFWNNVFSSKMNLQLPTYQVSSCMFYLTTIVWK